MLVGIPERAGRGAGSLSLVLTFSTGGCWWCGGRGRCVPSEGLVVVAVGRPVAEHLAGVAVGPLLPPAAVVRRVRRLLQRLRLRRAVLGVVQVEAAADVAEQTRLLLGQALLLTARAAPVTQELVLTETRETAQSSSKNGIQTLLHRPAVPPPSPTL